MKTQDCLFSFHFIDYNIISKSLYPIKISSHQKTRKKQTRRLKPFFHAKSLKSFGHDSVETAHECFMREKEDLGVRALTDASRNWLWSWRVWSDTSLWMTSVFCCVKRMSMQSLRDFVAYPLKEAIRFSPVLIAFVCGSVCVRRDGFRLLREEWVFIGLIVLLVDDSFLECNVPLFSSFFYIIFLLCIESLKMTQIFKLNTSFTSFLAIQWECVQKSTFCKCKL